MPRVPPSNPTPYYDVVKSSLSMATAIPAAILEGVNAGALTGSETNLAAYFKFISSQQTLIEYGVRELLDWLFESGQIQHATQNMGDSVKRKLLRFFGKDADAFDYEVNFNAGYESTKKSKEPAIC